MVTIKKIKIINMREFIKVKEAAEDDSESAVTFKESHTSHIDAFTDMKIN